ncbi:putative membrane protein [Candidatus Protofrankia californiensis]|uniref:Putative membrane protein n=1 Tax=Candidatus Protofrankia californiensis TaxID=1839754 RepID=A0A1C3PGU9_9ACTN|nr:putative membrane protein [Candidatus Protofrankia californiensis]
MITVSGLAVRIRETALLAAVVAVAVAVLADEAARTTAGVRR